MSSLLILGRVLVKGLRSWVKDHVFRPLEGASPQPVIRKGKRETRVNTRCWKNSEAAVHRLDRSRVFTALHLLDPRSYGKKRVVQ